MNPQNPLYEASINARLVADKACDEVEAILLAGNSVDWDSIFSKIDTSVWSTFVGYLIDFLRRSQIVSGDANIVSLFATTSPEIQQLVAGHLAVTLQSDDLESLEDHSTSASDDGVPETIEHFRIKKQIGLGGFGRVLLAHDTMLQKEVVLKIPRRSSIGSEKNLNAFIDEARKASLLESKGVVPIFHVGTFSGVPYIVQPFIRGGDLRQALATRQFTFAETASIIAEVATTIAEAHQKRLLHRDLKPANILLDDEGRPLVADFGLAIHESKQYEARGVFAGSVNYMSPEQVNGETHHMDGRSDIWSLGVILYQMLVNDLPFRAPNKSLLRAKICQQPPRPPRQLNSNVPHELERICLKCLSIRMTDRYGNGLDLALDLRDWLESQSAVAEPPSQVKSGHVDDILVDPASVRQSVIPRGLMSFNDQDEEFFLTLLPGTRLRDGTPEQIQYWLTRISRDRDQPTFSVGLIYGPSGCGKSSFVKAGLLPRLSRKTYRVYIESTDADTEVRLLVALRKQFPQLSRDLDLPDLLAALREGDWLAPGEKLLIVLDQFEQWLHANEIHAGLQLIEGLRQCDGARLQAIVMVRDDFWMKVTQFFHALEIQTSQQENYRGLDLFDAVHAKRVLAAFGRAYGKLPNDGSLTASQEQFLDEAIKRLIERDKIICIHLVMLAETVKHKSWELDSLPRGRHLHQIGVQYLEQSLSSNSTNPAFRFYHSAICRVLNIMLPVEGTDIKARFRDRDQLAIASGYSADSKEFAAVLDILEKQLKLISATDPDVGQANSDFPKSNDVRYYQLTHDFLVPSVRQWLEQLQAETPAGRATLRLQSLASGYEQSNDKRFLPTLLEFLAIARYVRVNACEPGARKVYWKAFTRYATQAVVGACLLILLTGMGYQMRLRTLKQRAEDWVTTWMTADGTALPVALKSLQVDAQYVIDTLKERKNDKHVLPDELVRIDLALALNSRVDESVFQSLVSYIGKADFAELPVLRKAFATNLAVSLDLLTSGFNATTDDEHAVKIALVMLHLQSPECLEKCLKHGKDEFRHLTAIHLMEHDIDDAEDFFVLLRAASRDDSVESIARNDRIAGVVKGLGRKDWSKVSTDYQQEWKAILTELLNDSASGPMHSAAEYALYQIGATPKQLLSKSIPTCPSVTKKWFVAPNGLTFVKVPAADKKLTIHPVHRRVGMQGEMQMDKLNDFWISTTEVTCSVYAQTQYEGASMPALTSHEFDHRPITDISILEAVRWCNRISKSEGLTPFYFEADKPFEFEKEDGISLRTVPADLKSWYVNPDATGYRIPKIEELFFAACMESKTCFPNSMSTRSLVNDYCWFEDNKREELNGSFVRTVGELMPNDLGLFDILGNAAELSLSSRDGKLAAWQPILRVGPTATLPQIITPYQFETELWQKLSKNTGFRLVRMEPRESQ